MNAQQQLTGQPVFETARLVCRRWRADDIDALFAVYADPEGSRWVGDGQPITWQECERWLRVTADNYATRGYGMFALDARADGQTLGFCGLVHPGGQTQMEIKYAFLRSHWGKGLASELVPAALDYAARAHGAREVIATVDPDNLGSQRVLLKSGFQFTQERVDDDGDLCRWYVWTKNPGER